MLPFCKQTQIPYVKSASELYNVKLSKNSKLNWRLAEVFAAADPIFYKFGGVYGGHNFFSGGFSATAKIRRIRNYTLPTQRSANLLEQPRVFTEFCKRCFICLSPNYWNSLPIEIIFSPIYDTFKRHLKIHFFSNNQQTAYYRPPGDCGTSDSALVLNCAPHNFMYYEFLLLYSKSKNLAIANRSRVSCAHNSSRASPWPWRLRTLRVTQGHWKRNHWTEHIRLTVRRVIGHWILSWPWNVGQRSLKVIEISAIRKLGCTYPIRLL